MQERHARAAEFQDLLRRVVKHLEAMPPSERLRWLELLSYVHALVYHERNPAEHEALKQEIEASVRTDQLRREVSVMGKTIADELIDKGRKEGRKKGRREEAIRARRQVLLDLLRERFGVLPLETATAVESNKSVQELDAWLRRVVTAATLEEIGITG